MLITLREMLGQGFCINCIRQLDVAKTMQSQMRMRKQIEMTESNNHYLSWQSTIGHIRLVHGIVRLTLLLKSMLLDITTLKN